MVCVHILTHTCPPTHALTDAYKQTQDHEQMQADPQEHTRRHIHRHTHKRKYDIKEKLCDTPQKSKYEHDMTVCVCVFVGLD